MKFSKPAIPLAEQIALLERRGMDVPDHVAAEHYLRHIGYYRLRAYWLPLEAPARPNGDHQFVVGTTFQNAVDLYVFDRHLRLLVIDAVERIEVSLRSSWAHYLSLTHGPHGYIDPNLYSRVEHYAKALTNLEEEIARSKDAFIIHYNGKYGDPRLPPAWMAAEVMSLGQLSKWIGNLQRRSDRNAIAKVYGLDEKLLVSIAHHLTYVRNICAHHGRLWNKQFTVTMSIPSSPASLKLAMNPQADRKLYNTLAIMAYLLDVIAPGTGWRNRLLDLLADHPMVNQAQMGFPDQWTLLAAWQRQTL